MIDRREMVVSGALALTALKSTSAHAVNAVAGFVEAERIKADIPGLAVGFARNGRVHWTQGFGLADMATGRRVRADTVFPIASITKTVTATMIMRLASSGRFKIDDPIAPFLDFQVVNPRYPNDAITFRHLMMHTSSLSDAKYYEVDFRVRGRDATTSLRDHLASLLVPGGSYYSADGCYAIHRPGEVTDYCNTGYGLLGYLIERITGVDGRSAIDRHILKPLGIKQAGWRLADIPTGRLATPYDIVDGKAVVTPDLDSPGWPAGSIRTSVADLTRFVAASANGGVARGLRILDASSMADMLDMKQPTGLPTWITGQGLAWQEAKLGATNKANHWGGSIGIFTAAYLDPQRRTGVAILTNATATQKSKDAIRAIAQHILDGATDK
jgi:CubicO group peptidase (beta-lactamase class C family)